MKCLLISSAIFLLLFSSFLISCLDAKRIPGFRSIIPHENSLSPVASYEEKTRIRYRDWIKVKITGPKVIKVKSGSRIELECEASGSPTPNVQWFHGQTPVSQTIIESNNIRGISLGNVMTILSIDCATLGHEGTYTCVAQSATQRAKSQPIMLYVQENITSLMSSEPICSHARPSSPRIVSHSSISMDTIGNDVILPCGAIGNPMPLVYWLDKDDSLVTSEVKPDPRYKVLDTGDLFISDLNWSDMGGYTCIAESPIGRDSTTTFLYPLAEK